MSEEELLPFIGLHLCPSFGYSTYQKISKLIQNPTELFTLSEKELRHFPLTLKQIEFICSWDNSHAEQILEDTLAIGANVLPISSDSYPPMLKQISDAPLLLFVKGDIDVLSLQQLAFVGSRSVSHYGSEVCNYLIEQFAGNQLAVTSGLALGVDGIAHQAALKNNLPTVAVMATGLNHIYPKRHRILAHEIAESGAVITEFLPNIPPLKYNFPKRNRIISGLSLGTVVIEASEKSGSLITAQCALEQNREVFAVPGNIFNPLSKGCHKLIEQGAKLVTSGADILNEFAISLSTQQVTKNHLAGSKLLASVDYDTTPVDVIVQRSKLPLDQVLMELLELEVQGVVIAVSGGYIKVAT